MAMANVNDCASEPWGRYSASGGVYPVGGARYLYSFGGDTGSDADGRGGVVRTNFRLRVDDGSPGPPGDDRCWERLEDGPTEIGYRATATRVEGDPDHVYVLFGSDVTRAATNQFYRYSLSRDAWTALAVDAGDDVPPPRWKHAAVALDEHRILVTGGRDGRTVRSDAWVFDASDLSWTSLDVPALPAAYRHGLAYDPSRDVVWMHGGLDGDFARHRRGRMWRLDLPTGAVTEAPAPANAAGGGNPAPPPLASHAMEYVAAADAVVTWGGTCGDDSELHVYDPRGNSWCRVFAANRPDRRDAMLWSLQFPNFYVAGGDIICYNRQVLTIMDVHVLDLQDVASGDGVGGGWDMLYEPTNVPRGTGAEPYCDGNNAGNCQPRPLLDDVTGSASTCSPDLLARFANADIEGGHSGGIDNPSAMDGSSAEDPTGSDVEAEPPIVGDAPSPTAMDTSDGQQSGSPATARPSLALAWMLLLFIKRSCNY